MLSSSRIERLALVAVALFVFLMPTRASAHLANFGSWELTREYLGELFPKADEFKAKKDTYDDAEVARLQAELGFELYPEDRTPTFYIAEAGGRFLGVAIFIDPRVTPTTIEDGVVTLEVGIAVDPAGAIHRVKVFDYRGDLALTRDAFLDQFRGRTLDSTFQMGEDGLVAVVGEEEESQLVANAAREALLLMRESLSKPTADPAPAPAKAPSGCSTGGPMPPATLVFLFLVFGCIRCRNR